jgi:hypothetical protein
MERNKREVKGKLKGHYLMSDEVPVNQTATTKDYRPFNFSLTSLQIPLTSIS